MTNTREVRKLELVNRILNKVKTRKRRHFAQFKYLKRINIIAKSIVNTLNTVSVTGLVLTFSGNDISLYISASANTVSTIITAIMSIVNIESKYHSHQTSYLQFKDLYDTYMAEILKEDIEGHDMDRILNELNTRVNIILDTCEPVSISYSKTITSHHEEHEEREGA
jgi:hypothetical protein